MNSEHSGGWSRRRKILTFGAAGAVAVIVAVVLLWLLVWRGDAPPPPSVLERSEALTATSTSQPPPPPAESPPAESPPAESPPAVESATSSESPPAVESATSSESPPAVEPAPPAESPPAPEPAPQPGPYPDPEPAPPPAEAPTAPSPPAAEPPPPDGTAPAVPEARGEASLDGVWSVNTTLGSFADYSSSWAGYRVGEELSGIGTTDAVGRTAAVSGTLEIAGATVVVATVDVDLRTLVSDRPQRDGLVQRALNTGQFPTARFELTEPVTFDALPAAGEQVTATAAGAFTVHGVSRPVEIALEATWVDDIVIVGGIFEIRFEDYGINPPSAAVVLSVEDTATVELLLNFTR